MDRQIILCDGFEVVPPPEPPVMNELILSESDQSVSDYEITTDEEDTVFSGDSSPEIGADEEDWHGDKPFSFYFVKQPVFDDPEIKAKIDEANEEIFHCNNLRIDVAKKSEKVSLYFILLAFFSSLTFLDWQVRDLVGSNSGSKVEALGIKMHPFLFY